MFCKGIVLALFKERIVLKVGNEVGRDILWHSTTMGVENPASKLLIIKNKLDKFLN